MKSTMTYGLARILLAIMLAMGLSACSGEEEATSNGTEANGEQAKEQNGDTPREEAEGGTSAPQY